MSQIQEIVDAIPQSVVPVKSDKEIVVEIISRKAQESGVDHAKMLNIAYEESGFDCTAKNRSSTAAGCFQIIDGTWRAFNCTGTKLDAYDNIACAMKIAQDSYRHWDASYDYEWKGRRIGWKYERFIKGKLAMR